MFYTYLLYSASLDKYYKGHSINIEARLKKHNRGEVKYTSKGIPWELILFVRKESRSEAMKLERKLKNLNRSRLESFIIKYGNRNKLNQN